MIIIMVMIALLGAAFIVHTIRILSLNKRQNSKPQGFERILALLGGLLVLVGLVGIALTMLFH